MLFPICTFSFCSDYEPELLAFERWWRTILEARAAAGDEMLYVEPEFGPAPYMDTLPYTHREVADIWEVNLWMAERLRRTFADLTVTAVAK